jgi:hypothetical protein
MTTKNSEIDQKASDRKVIFYSFIGVQNTFCENLITK